MRGRGFRKFAAKVIRAGNEKKIFVGATTYDGGLSTPVGCAADYPVNVCVTAITQGDTEFTRDGNQCSLRSLEVFVAFTPNPLYTPAAARSTLWGALSTTGLLLMNYHVRVIVYQILPVSDSANPPVLGDNILQTMGAQYYGPHNYYNHDNRRNYRILYDRVRKVSDITTPAGTGAGDNAPGWSGGNAGSMSMHFRIRKFANRVLTWISSGTTANNHVYLAIFPDWLSVEGTSTYPLLATYNVKTSFSDK